MILKPENGGDDAGNQSSGISDSPSLSGHFISLISIRSRQDSRHEKETQTASSLSPIQPISGDRHQSKLKSFFSLLLSRKYPLIRLSERKYEKVGKFMRRNGITW